MTDGVTPVDSLGNQEDFDDLLDDFVFRYRCDECHEKPAVKWATWYVGENAVAYFCSLSCGMAYVGRLEAVQHPKVIAPNDGFVR